MNKKTTSILIISALIVVGAVGFMMGQNSSTASADSLPEDPQIENASAEDVVDNLETQDNLNADDSFTDVYYERYVIKDLDVYESPSTDSKSLGKVKFNICIVCIREGFGEMEDWAQAIGYINGEKFNGYVQREYLSESKIVVQQPVQQKPSSNAQKPSSNAQKPVEQKPSNEVQKPVEQKPSNDYVIPGAVSGEDFIDGTEHIKITEENIKATQEAVDRTQGTLHPN